MSKTSQLPIVLLLVFLVPLWALSDKRLCADPKCSKTISLGIGKVNYRAADEGMVSFKINANMRIMSKSAGSEPQYWGIDVGGRQGYVPKNLIQETKIFISHTELQYEVPVTLPDSVPIDSTTVLKTSELVEGTPNELSNAPTAPLNVPSTSDDVPLNVVSKNILENTTITETPIATQVQPAVEVVDGTAVPLLNTPAKAAVAAAATPQNTATAKKITISDFEQPTTTTLPTKSDGDEERDDRKHNKTMTQAKPADNQNSPQLKDVIAHSDDGGYDEDDADYGDNGSEADALKQLKLLARKSIGTQPIAPSTASEILHYVKQPLDNSIKGGYNLEPAPQAPTESQIPAMNIAVSSAAMKIDSKSVEAQIVEPVAHSITDDTINLTYYEVQPAAIGENKIKSKQLQSNVQEAERNLVNNGDVLIKEDKNGASNIPNAQTIDNDEPKEDAKTPKTTGLEKSLPGAAGADNLNAFVSTLVTGETAPHSQRPNTDETASPAQLNIAETTTLAPDSLNTSLMNEFVHSTTGGKAVPHTVTPAPDLLQHSQMPYSLQQEKDIMAEAEALESNAPNVHEDTQHPKMDAPRPETVAPLQQLTTPSPVYTYHQATSPSQRETDGPKVYAYDHQHYRAPVHTYNANHAQETSTTPQDTAAVDTETARDEASTNINAAEHYHPPSHLQHDNSEPLDPTTTTSPTYTHLPAGGWHNAAVDSDINDAEQQHPMAENAPSATPSAAELPVDHAHYLSEDSAAEQQQPVTESGRNDTPSASELPAGHAHYVSLGNDAEQQHPVTESAPSVTPSPAKLPTDHVDHLSDWKTAEQRHPVTESTTSATPYGDGATNINTNSEEQYTAPPLTHESSKSSENARSPLQTDEPKERGLFATILGTVDTFWSNVKREVRDVADKKNLAPPEDFEPAESIWYRAAGGEAGAPAHSDSADREYAYCYAASDHQVNGGVCDRYSSETKDTVGKALFKFDAVLDSLTGRMLEMSELLSCLAIAAVSSLLFIFGYYCFCTNSSEGALLSKLNHMERTLISSQKENLILRDETQPIGSEITSMQSGSSLAEVPQSVDSAEMEALLQENEQLNTHIRDLEKELEEATESGLELNKMLAEMLSMQSTTTVGAALENQVSELEGLLETQRSEAYQEYNARLAEKDREISDLQLTLAEQSARMRSEILSLQRDNDELETEKSNLEARLLEAKREIESSIAKQAEEHVADVAVLNNQICELKQQCEHEHAKLQTSLAKLEALEECLTHVKRDPSVNINEVINTANILAEINDLKKKRNSLTSKLDTETEARRLAENQLQVVTDEIEELKQQFHSAEKDKLEAQTRLEVLSNYFREKETQLQKELSLKEAMWLKKQGETTSTVDRLTTMQDEIQSLKSQNDELRAEIEAQLAAHKAQTGTLERRSHENWLDARHAARRYNEARGEAATLRQKLTALAASNELNRHFETAPSPIQIESPGSPMLGAIPPPPFLPPPPFMAGMPPPYMNMPTFVPPLPPMSGGYDYYDDSDEDEEEEDEYYSPPHSRRRRDSWTRRDSNTHRTRHRDRERYRSSPPPPITDRNSPRPSGSSVL